MLTRVPNRKGTRYLPGAGFLFFSTLVKSYQPGLKYTCAWRTTFARHNPLTVNGRHMPSLPQDLIDQFVGNAHGNLAVVQALLSQHPSLLNADASWHEHAIEAAAQTAQVEIIELLLAAGAPLDICTAAVMGMQDNVEAFLRADPSAVHARGAHGIPLMYFPVIRGQIDIADLLLQRGADLNAASPGGITPLHGAVMFNQPGMAAWMLDHAAYPNLRYDGKTPLAIAKEKGFIGLAELLTAHGGLE